MKVRMNEQVLSEMTQHFDCKHIDNIITDLLLMILVYPMKQRCVHFSNLFPWFIPKTGGGNQRGQLVMQYGRFQHFDSTAAVNHTADGGR